MRTLVITCVIGCLAGAGFATEKPVLSADELLSKHVASLGPAETLATLGGRGIEASAKFAITQGGGGVAEGTAKMASDGTKTRFNLRLKAPAYMGEDFTCDGAKVQISRLVGGKTALLGAFFWDKDFLLKEGIFGGVLSTAWPLLNAKGTKAKVKYTGAKKIDGRDLHELQYEPKDSYPGLQVRIYLEPETLRHVLTVYEWHVRAGMDGGRTIGRGRVVPNATDQGVETLRESFTNFQTVDGVTLPSLWTIELSKEANASTKMRWDFSVVDTVHGEMNPIMFKVK